MIQQHHPAGKSDSQLQLSGNIQVLYHSHVNWANDSVLNEEESDNVAQCDTAQHVCLGAVTNVLYYGMLLLTAPNSAFMVFTAPPVWKVASSAKRILLGSCYLHQPVYSINVTRFTFWYLSFGWMLCRS